MSSRLRLYTHYNTINNKYRAVVIWDKGNHTLSNSDYMNHYKPISVLNIFGSGFTLIACEQLNKCCYILEKKPVYCQIIINRWKEYTDGKADKIT